MVESVILQVKAVSKQFSAKQVPAVNQVSFDLNPGIAVYILGPSGCGKTTLLRMIAGFEKPCQGSIILGNTVVAGGNNWIEPEKR